MYLLLVFIFKKKPFNIFCRGNFQLIAILVSWGHLVQSSFRRFGVYLCSSRWPFFKAKLNQGNEIGGILNYLDGLFLEET